MMPSMLDKIINWATQQTGIVVMLLVGSRAGNNFDALSDCDISIFGEDYSYIKNDNWLHEIQDHWVCIHEKFMWNETKIPTRLVIFEDAVKVDFAFHPLSLLYEMIDEQKLSPAYDSGFKILLDKENIAARLPPPSLQAYLVL